MKKLKIFYLENCPYCRKAADAYKELKSENPGFEKVETEWIEESRCPEIADRYDYYYVPTVFCDEEKLYECSPADDYGKIKRNFELALKAAAEK
jgi:glutaredoxin